MRTTRGILMILGACALLFQLSPTTTTARGRRPASERLIRVDPPPSPLSLDRALPSRWSGRPQGGPAAAPDTTILGSWDFDDCTPQGWISVDRTAQIDTFFHVDDFAGLGGGDFGRLVPIEGSQSLWCGARPTTACPLCSYLTLPGYGNNWDQSFRTTDCLAVTGDVTVDYLVEWDAEQYYDFTTLEFDKCDDNWITFAGGLGVYDGVGSGHDSYAVPSGLHSGEVRLRFRFESDVEWSDEDGEHDTDGAVIVDSLTVSDATGVVLPTEDFEAESPGDRTTLSGNWTAEAVPGYGDFSALFEGLAVLQEDPCVSNLSCFWGFFSGSTATYAWGGHPEQVVVPYPNQRGQYIHNEIWSPWMPLTGQGNTFELAFDVYRDLYLDGLVFYVWHVRSLVGGFPGQWRNDYVYYGNKKDWFRYRGDLSTLVEEGADSIQVAIGVIDKSDVWYCWDFCFHTQAPLIDNIEVRRIDTNGPRWAVSDRNLFQDNFAGDGTTTGTVRADAAVDINSASVPQIHPGDSVVVTVDNPEGAIVADPYSGAGPAVYALVSVRPQGQPDKSANALASDGQRWPFVSSHIYAGNVWYWLRMDTVFAGAGRTSPVAGKYCVDLNDDLFTPGDTVFYAFGAEGTGGEITYYSRFTGTTDDRDYALDNAMEFTCLPTQHANVAYPTGYGGYTAPILYVDGADGYGVQPYFDAAFDALGISGAVDRYDILAPSSRWGNRPGGRVVDVEGQLLPAYRKIIWSTGNLELGTIGNGFGSNDKSPDATMLLEFLDALPSRGGVYFTGDDVANRWAIMSSGNLAALRDTYMSFDVFTDDHKFSYPISPRAVAVDGGMFDHLAPDTLVAYGGCPTIANFDMIAPQGNAVAEMAFEGSPDPALQAAVISQFTVNPESVLVGVVLSGFSYHDARDERSDGQPVYYGHHLGDVLGALGPDVGTAVPSSPLRYALAQNYPNPFNPTTSIEFTLRERGRVTLRVYNVAGQLVTTLVDGVRAPGITHRVEWDGRNGAGQSVASGVYFYRLQTTGFTKTKKMVLLK